MKIAFLFVVLLCAGGPVLANALSGVVVAVPSGDTLVVKIDDGEGKSHQEEVRLVAIAAPVAGQAFSGQSRDALASTLKDKAVSVEWTKRDAHHRVIGRTTESGHDVGLNQIKAGLAWYARSEASELGLEDQGFYLSGEVTARRSKSGVWSEASPIPPWVYAKTHKATQ